MTRAARFTTLFVGSLGVLLLGACVGTLAGGDNEGDGSRGSFGANASQRHQPQSFRHRGAVYRSFGAEGHCRFASSSEARCHLGLASTTSLPNQTSQPNTPALGPCYVQPSCWRGSVKVRRGDIVLFGEVATVQGDERYLEQKLLANSQANAAVLGLYDAFWGADSRSWDDTPLPWGQRAYWTNITVSSVDGTLRAPHGAPVLVLRPTALTGVLNIDHLVERHQGLDTSAPFPHVPIFFRFVKWAQRPGGVDWIANRPSIYPQWSQLYDVDLDALRDPVVMVDGGGERDLARASFWQRDLHPASAVAWSLIDAWSRQDKSVRSFVLGDPDVCAAVDSITPGRLGRWLHDSGLAELVDAPMSVQLKVRREGSAGWRGAHLGNAPLEGLDLQVTALGSGSADVAISCRAGEPAQRVASHTLPKTLELKDRCSYGTPGTYLASVELRQGAKVVARHGITIVATATSIQVQKGDIVMWGSPALSSDDVESKSGETPRPGEYGTQTYLAQLPAVGVEAGVYAPFFGPSLRSWDDSAAPHGQRFFYGHIDIATETGSYKVYDGFVYTVLRPTAAMRAVVDLDAAVEKIPTLAKNPYSQPFVGVTFAWLVHARDQGLLGATSARKAFWRQSIGIDLDSLETPQMLQHAPNLEVNAYTDLKGDALWRREVDCSSLAMWALLGGWVAKHPSARESFLGKSEVAGAIDALSPGQVAWWLSDVGYVSRVE